MCVCVCVCVFTHTIELDKLTDEKVCKKSIEIADKVSPITPKILLKHRLFSISIFTIQTIESRFFNNTYIKTPQIPHSNT